jgi:hypothetical protein
MNISNPYAWLPNWNFELNSDHVAVLVLFLLVAFAFLAGIYGAMWRARGYWQQKRERQRTGAIAAPSIWGVSGRPWRTRRDRFGWRGRRGKPKAEAVVPNTRSSAPDITDPSDQLRIVMRASFQKCQILSNAEYRVYSAATKAIASAKLNWRVMCQVSLGEVLSSPDPLAYRAINSKRVDLLIISSNGEPLAAIEYQGNGHYQGTAAARDAVKKEALRKAGVRYIEVTPEHTDGELERQILRLARVEQLKPAP